MKNAPIYSVTQVNQYIKGLLDRDGALAGLFVRGELSNYKAYPSGHHYFSLKDAEGAIRCVMFRREAMGLRFRPENGMKVVAFGRVTVFPRDGQYQLYCSELTPDGVGDLHVAFEQLKQKTAYEISACLVGSEMCIRDSPRIKSLSDARTSSAFPAGKGRPRSTPVRSMSCPAEMSLVPPTHCALTLTPSGST